MKAVAKPGPLAAAARPLKRPTQARSKFTVQAIYDAFVRIWRRDGWAGVTTRAIALETGVSVGALYDYFPSKQAVLSGYVRHCIDRLLVEIDVQVVAPAGLRWTDRVARLVRLNCGVDAPELPYFDAEMLSQEAQIAEPKHHARVFEELSTRWLQAIDACTDLMPRPDRLAIETLFSAVWGGRRYLLLVRPRGFDAQAWARELERICCAALAQPVVAGSGAERR